METQTSRFVMQAEGLVIHCECGEPGIFACDNCDRRFCEDHGQRGGDRQVQDVGPVAYPAMCDQCRNRS